MWSDLEEYSDSELAHLACLGSREAWQTLYERYLTLLWDIARSQLKLPEELRADRRDGLRGRAITAEQFMSEVYVVMWKRKKFCSYRGVAPFQSWYTVVARTIFNDLLRQERRAYPPGIEVSSEDKDDE